MDILSEIRNIFSQHEKTLFEQETEIWQEITLLENKLSEAKTADEKNILTEKLARYKQQIKDLNDNNPQKLRYKIKELEEELIRVNELNKESRALTRYYEIVLSKYEPELADEKTADNLKALVSYKSIEIDVILASLKSQTYSYDNNYLSVIEKYFTYLKDKFYFIERQRNIKFWLDAIDIIKARTGDPLDIAILTCSVMHALGDFNAMVYFVELGDFTNHAYVRTKYKNRILIFDPAIMKKYDDFLGYEAVANEKYMSYGKHIKRTIYKFNAFDFESE